MDQWTKEKLLFVSTVKLNTKLGTNSGNRFDIGFND